MSLRAPSGERMEAEGPERELGAEGLAPDTGQCRCGLECGLHGRAWVLLMIELQSPCPSTFVIFYLGTEVICPVESVTAGQKEAGR